MAAGALNPDLFSRRRHRGLNLGQRRPDRDLGGPRGPGVRSRGWRWQHGRCWRGIRRGGGGSGHGEVPARAPFDGDLVAAGGCPSRHGERAPAGAGLTHEGAGRLAIEVQVEGSGRLEVAGHPPFGGGELGKAAQALKLYLFSRRGNRGFDLGKRRPDHNWGGLWGPGCRPGGRRRRRRCRGSRRGGQRTGRGSGASAG